MHCIATDSAREVLKEAVVVVVAVVLVLVTSTSTLYEYFIQYL